MFTDGDGKPVHPHAVYEAFRRIVHNEGVPAIRYHDLRHTHGSLLIRDGIPVKVVSERLGHANIAFTMQTYQHLLPGMQAEAAETALRIIVDGWYRAPLDAKAPERCGGPSLHRPLVVPTR